MSEQAKEIKLVGCLPVIVGFFLLAATIKGCDYADAVIARERAALECAKIEESN